MKHVVKRYGGERLYDTTALAYTTVEALRALRKRSVEVIVTDAVSGEDLTAILLA